MAKIGRSGWNDWKWLYMAGISLKFLDMARIAGNSWKWLEMTLKLDWLEMTGNYLNGWKWLER